MELRIESPFNLSHVESALNAINMVRHVRVECPGFATVSFNCDEGSCLTVFGSGTNLLTTPESTYQVCSIFAYF